MGGDHGHGHGGTLPVWSPSGGWYPDPKHWRRNTATALAALGVAVAVTFYTSANLEYRPLKPVRWIPSQSWVAASHFGATPPPIAPKLN